MSKKVIGFYTAISVVIANMIGTGVFTSLGFQIPGTDSVFALLLLWLIGGVVALCGALSYGELAAAMPRSGGEYHYLSRIFHPAVGFLAGWVSATVGFAAPVAAAAMALGSYSSTVLPSLDPIIFATAVIAALTVVHSTSLKTGSGLQNVFTFIKIALILVIIGCGVFMAHPQPIDVLPGKDAASHVFAPAFAVSLYWVSYAYSGWNASAYIAGEIQNPQRNLPRSLFRGTLFVTVLYVLLNFVFLYAAPQAELAGVKEVGAVAAKYIFGITGGQIVSGIIAVLLISTISSMILAGPRVTMAMGEDNSALRFFAKKSRGGIPFVAVITQTIISLGFLYTAAFDEVVMYISFTLNLFTFLTVLGLFVLRIKRPDLPRPYKTWGYPITPAIFLLVTGWILGYALYLNPLKSLLMAVCTLGPGLLLYFIGNKRRPGTTINEPQIATNAA